MNNNELRAKLLIEVADLLAENDQESLNEGIISYFKKRKEEKEKQRIKEMQDKELKDKYNKLWNEMCETNNKLEKEVCDEIDKIDLPSHQLPDNNDDLYKLFKSDLKYLIQKINSKSSIINKCRKIVDNYNEPYTKVYGGEPDQYFSKFIFDEFEYDTIIIINDGQEVASALLDITCHIGSKVNKNLSNKFTVGYGDGDEGIIDMHI